MNRSPALIVLVVLGCSMAVFAHKKAEYKINPFFGYHKYKIVKYQPFFLPPPPVYAPPPPPPPPSYDYKAPPPAYDQAPPPSYAPVLPPYEQAPTPSYSSALPPIHDQASPPSYEPAPTPSNDLPVPPPAYYPSAQASPSHTPFSGPGTPHDIPVDAHQGGSYYNNDFV